MTALIRPLRRPPSPSGEGSGYDEGVKSRLAEELKVSVLGDVEGLSLDQRIDLTLELGEQDLQAYLASSGLTRE